MMAGAMDFMTIFNVFIAVYLLYYGIKGTGKLYEGDYPKAMRESHNKLLRKFCLIVGFPMLAMSILEYMYGFMSIWGTLNICYVLGAVVVYFIIFQMRYRQYLKPQNAKTPAKTGGKKKK